MEARPRTHRQWTRPSTWVDREATSFAVSLPCDEGVAPVTEAMCLGTDSSESHSSSSLFSFSSFSSLSLPPSHVSSSSVGAFTATTPTWSKTGTQMTLTHLLLPQYLAVTRLFLSSSPSSYSPSSHPAAQVRDLNRTFPTTIPSFRLPCGQDCVEGKETSVGG